MKVVGRDDFLNQSLVGPFDWTGRKRGTPVRVITEENSRRQTQASKLSEEQKRKISESLKGNEEDCRAQQKGLSRKQGEANATADRKTLQSTRRRSREYEEISCSEKGSISNLCGRR